MAKDNDNSHRWDGKRKIMMTPKQGMAIENNTVMTLVGFTFSLKSLTYTLSMAVDRVCLVLPCHTMSLVI